MLFFPVEFCPSTTARYITLFTILSVLQLSNVLLTQLTYNSNTAQTPTPLVHWMSCIHGENYVSIKICFCCSLW